MLQHCFYINLETRTDRKQFIENQLDKSNILKNIYERFAAIDGRTIHPREVNAGILTENAIKDILLDTPTVWGLSVTQGGLGILLTYRKLFEKITLLDSPAITFEDDVTLIDDFDVRLENVLTELPSDFDLCYLGYGESTIETEYVSNNISIPTGQITCLPSMIISPKGAKKLLNILVDIDNQVDTALYIKGKHLNAFVSNEKLVRIENTMKTDIQGNVGCTKEYQLQNYIFATLAVGEDANSKALKLCYDLKYFNQNIVVVTDSPRLYKDLTNVEIVPYPEKQFSYNDKIICFEKGFERADCVVYIDADSRIFYDDYKLCYTNFFRIIKPGFHSSWDWGKLTRENSRFFTSTDVPSRTPGYGELALQVSKELNIPIENAMHYQEGVLIVSKEDGKEKILLDTWKQLASVLDAHEIANGAYRIGIGEGNLFGLAVAKSNITVHPPQVSNYLGNYIKYNFCSGGQIADYIQQYPNRKTVTSTDSTILKSNVHSVIFNDKTIDLSYVIYELTDSTLSLNYTWNTTEAVEFLDHEFKINNIVYHFNSEKFGEIIFEKQAHTTIYHTYDWYGERNWVLIEDL